MLNLSVGIGWNTCFTHKYWTRVKSQNILAECHKLTFLLAC
jgi:hypothetical protein